MRIQRDLFALGSRLADPSHRIADRVTKAVITPRGHRRLEGWIDALEAELPPLRRFILARRHARRRRAARRAHDRAAARERAIVALDPDTLEPELLVYVNRLSDLLFVMARAVNRRAAVPELEW